jgi:8-oxo-dGTP pyrophosphatase MutT (NUDIX family)
MEDVAMPIQSTLVRQAGVIPLRNGKICLVTSRSGKRWVVPKGCMESGMTASEVALEEAWEEAGLVGIIGAEPIGSYVYEKDGATCHVIVYLLEVTDAVDSYPEAAFRERIWLSITQSLSRIDDPGLRELIRTAAMQRVGRS